MRKARTNEQSRTLAIIGAVVLILISCGIGYSRYGVELGLVHASPGAVHASALIAEVEPMLEQGADFSAFSAALSSNLVVQRKLAAHNIADGRVRTALSNALDCYSALRQSYQAELEGEWDGEIYGDPAYWRLFHPAVQLPSADHLDSRELETRLRAEALGYVNEALAVAER